MENTIQMTKAEQAAQAELIDNVLGFYIADPKSRAVDAGGNCSYLTSDGRMCAVGRCLDTKRQGYKELVDQNWAVGGDECTDARLDEALRPEFRGRSVDFWQMMQRMHDTPDYWTTEGLSQKGAALLAELKTTPIESWDDLILD